MDKHTLGVIIPTYGHFDYAAKAVRTALDNTRMARSVAVVVDDGSPGGLDGMKDLHYKFEAERERLVLHRFDDNGGLTRAWNKGLELCLHRGMTYACCGNSDLVFPPFWDMALLAALDARNVHLVGPVSNAPGTCKEQEVGQYLDFIDYEVTDDPDYLKMVQVELRDVWGSTVKEATLNGFCMVARTKTWWDHAYDRGAGQVFKPRNDTNSKGQPNPTPLMTLNEYELQRRWHAAGLTSAVCPGSFVFHYRSVSRGDAHKQGNWYRMQA